MGERARVACNAGLFRTDSDDILFTASPVQGRGFFQNIGATRRQGAEAGVNVRQGSFLALADADGLVQVQRGNRLPGIP